MNKKKILIFSLAYSPRWGGAEVAIKEITDRVGNDFSFDMVTLRFDSELPPMERVGNIQVYRIGFSKKKPTDRELVQFPMYLAKILYAPLAFQKAVSLYKKNKYDAFWVMMAYAGFPVVLFRKLYKKIPYMLTLQEGDPISYMTARARIRLVYPILKNVFTGAYAISAISTYLGGYARAMGFKKPVHIIPNGANVKNFKFQISDFKFNELRKKIGVGERDVVLITTSRLVQKNAIDDIIQSLSFLPAHIKLLIAGVGPDELMLKKLVNEHALNERVFFLGHIAYDTLPLYYQTADIFVRPSLSEGMGSSFIEAMASGLPVVATAVGGIVDFLKDKETGFICEVKNPESIAKQVRYIIDPRNKDIVARIVQKARALTEEKYDWNIIARQMKGVFKQLV